MALTLLSPLMFQGVKLPELMKNSPTVDMNTSGMNFRIDVQVWTAPMFLTPLRLIAAGTQRPTSAISMETYLLPPLLRNSSTYSTQPTTIAAFPDHAVIQYSQALEKPARLPKPARA